MVRQIGPGMLQQVQTQCPACHGKGEQIAEADKCTTCQGEHTVKESKTIEVHINRGMSHGQKLVFKGEGDQAPDTDPGDVVVVLQQKEHPSFRREGANLFMKKQITLAEALCGFRIKIPHLDDRILVVKSNDGEIVKPGDTKVIRDEGMPATRAGMAGSLYITFEIVFPATGSLDAKTRQSLNVLLGGKPIEEKKAAAPASPAASADKKTAGPPGGAAPPAAAAAGSKAQKKKNRKARRAAEREAEAKKDGKDAKAIPEDDEDGEDDDKTPAEPVEEEVSMEDVDMSQERARFAQQQRESHARSAHDDDDDDDHGHGHGGQPGCRAQ